MKVGRLQFRLLVLMLACSKAGAQIITNTTNVGPQVSIGEAAANETTYRLWQIGEGTFGSHSALESPNGSVSALDLKAPGKARREYEKGYQLLQRKEPQKAVAHLTLATSIYPNYVAAHNALGSAYLALTQNREARAEFAKAATLDDHLPSSYLNLACAELALKDYAAAEESIRKASEKAPLDLHMQTALAYGQFMNRNYQGAIATAQRVHTGKHLGFAKVHLYAAAGWQAQNNIAEARQELELFLREDPKSPTAARVTDMLRQLNEAPAPGPVSAPVPALQISYAPTPGEGQMRPGELPEAARKFLLASRENEEIKDAESEAACPECETTAFSSGEGVAVSGPHPGHPSPNSRGFVLHASADEVAVFFGATDHRKSVTNLRANDISILDNHRLPAAITGFRNESELPLRLGIVIDTSASITGRLKFEQDSATEFLQQVLTGPKDLAFVVGVSNSVLLVQDFTNNPDSLSHSVGQLAPSGGTALWDAVAFASDKLARRPEEHPVAKLLVVLSDGENNSSTVTLKDVVDQAQRDEVFIYTVSTREDSEETDLASSVGNRALKTLAELTGGAAFAPGSIHRLNASLGDLQELIRGRYLISYKPAEFQRDGQYRPIDITAKKDGHKLRVYARKGYFASVNALAPRD